MRRIELQPRAFEQMSALAPEVRAEAHALITRIADESDTVNRGTVRDGLFTVSFEATASLVTVHSIIEKDA